MEKLLLVFSNWIFVISVREALIQGDLVAAFLVANSGIASTVHHIIEERFGFKPLIKIKSDNIRWLVLQWDRIAPLLAAYYLFDESFFREQFVPIIGLISAMIISDVVCWTTLISRPVQLQVRTILHTIWHAGAFYIAYLLVLFRSV